MLKIRYLIIVITFSFILVNCSSKKNFFLNKDPLKIYISAQQNLLKSKYNDAIKEFNKLNNCYPFNQYMPNIYLSLIYAYYISGDLEMAQSSINRFLQFYPNNPNIDYILYMHGLINMSLERNILQKFFNINNFNYNSDYMQIAFRDFMQLIRFHPNSKYILDATKRLVYLKNILAKHELSIVDYYDKIRAYVAVVNRVELMMRNFPDTKATRQALFYMRKAYQKLHLNDQVEKVTKIIAVNPI